MTSATPVTRNAWPTWPERTDMEARPMTATSPPASPYGDRYSLRPTEIADLHGLSKGVVYAALERGALHGSRIGRTWVVAVDEVERWIRSDGAPHPA